MRYAIMFNADSKTLTVQDEGADSTTSAVEGTSKAVGVLVYGEFGEIPGAESHPQPHQHLENMARRLALDPREVTVKNETGNPRLDFINRDGVELPEGTSMTDDLAANSAIEDAEGDHSEFKTHEEELHVESKVVEATTKLTPAQQKKADAAAEKEKEADKTAA